MTCESARIGQSWTEFHPWKSLLAHMPKFQELSQQGRVYLPGLLFKCPQL